MGIPGVSKLSCPSRPKPPSAAVSTTGVRANDSPTRGWQHGKMIFSSGKVQFGWKFRGGQPKLPFFSFILAIFIFFWILLSKCFGHFGDRIPGFSLLPLFGGNSHPGGERSLEIAIRLELELVHTSSFNHSIPGFHSSLFQTNNYINVGKLV